MQILVIVRNIFGVKREIILKLSIIVDFHHGWENERKYRCDWTLSHDAILWYKGYKVVDSQHLSQVYNFINIWSLNINPE